MDRDFCSDGPRSKDLVHFWVLSCAWACTPTLQVKLHRKTVSMHLAVYYLFIYSFIYRVIYLLTYRTDHALMLFIGGGRGVLPGRQCCLLNRSHPHHPKHCDVYLGLLWRSPAARMDRLAWSTTAPLSLNPLFICSFCIIYTPYQ